MNEKLINQIGFSFDIQNNRELTPYIFYTEPSLHQEINDSFSNYNSKDFHHQPWINRIFQAVKTDIYSKKYYGNDQDEKENYEKNTITKIINSLRSINPTSIEDYFIHSTNIVINQQSNLQSFVHWLKKKLIRDLRQMAISTQSFPHFKSNDLSNFHALQDVNLDDSDFTKNEEIEKIQKDEQKMKSIISQTAKDENQDDKKPLNYSVKDLTEFYEILCKYNKAFTFSPSFIIFCIQKLDSFLNFLIDPSNKPSQNSDEEKNDQNDQKHFNYFRNINSTDLNDNEKQKKLNYFYLILRIKMRLYMMIHKSSEFLCLLIEMFILEDDRKSIETTINEILPETNRRSKIVKNILSSEVIDFCFSHDEKNDFILTKEGILEASLNDFDISNLKKVVFDDKDNSKINESLKKCTTFDTKIASSDGILYLVCSQDQKIYKSLIHTDEQILKKEHHPISQPKNDQNKKRKSEKKLQQIKEKKDKKKQRRMERKETQKPDPNLENTSINIPDLPIVSVGAYNDYVRIIQKKESNNGKTKFLLTNVDLTPNSRIMNFDVEEIFNEKNTNDKTSNQTQFEIEIKDKNKKYKVHDICFSKDYIYFVFEDSTLEKWLIFNDGKAEISKEIISPFIISPQTRLKMDNNEFLYVLEPISNAVSINKMHLPYTKYYIRSENEVFLKYPYLQKLSDIVDNCTHLIINRKVTTNITTSEYLEVKKKEEEDDDDNGKKKKKVKIVEQNPFEFSVSPTEMSFVVQSINSLSSQVEFIQFLIENIKDEDLKKFFIPLFVKICGISILYGIGIYYVMKDKMGNAAIERFKILKNFILSLYSLFGISNSLELEMIIKESMLITFSLCGKFIFIQDSDDEVHSFMNKLLSLNDLNNEYPKFLLRSLSFLMFTYPSLLYIIDDEIYNQLLKYDKEINLHELFFSSILFIKLEVRFAKKIMYIEFVQRISTYLDCLFKYINYLLTDESIPLIKAEEIFSCIFGIYTSNPIYSLLMVKKFIEISETLYNKIKSIKGVLESDQEFFDKNQDVADMTVSKVIKVFESEHPYDLSKPAPDKIIKENVGFRNNEIVEEIGTVDFESEADTIFLLVDTRSKLHDSDYLSFYIKNDKYNPTNLSTTFHFSFNQLIKYDSNKIRITFTRRKNESQKAENPAWGFKLTFIGVKFNNPYCWYANLHLNLYNHFIYYLTMIYSNAFKSTDLEENEKEFNLILEQNIIQGIKLEDIDNYELSLNQNKDENKPKNGNKQVTRTLTRGISRGINYEQDNDSTYDDQFKKSFIKDLITVNDQSSTLGKQLLDILYAKTAKQNRIRINQANKSILENEHYLAACLFKQLGLINVAIKFIKNVKINENTKDKYEGIEIPICLQTLWKNIYSLRKTLIFEYQKSKLPTNSNQSKTKYNFVEYSEEIKRKCKLLLYSDPVLKFKQKGNFSNKTIEETTKSIMSFVTSKTPISSLSELIDKRRKKLSISRESILLMNDFIQKKLLFKSSKPIFEDSYRNCFVMIQKFNGVTYNELNDFKKLFGSLSYSIIKELFTEPTAPIIINQFFLRQSVFLHEDVESMLNISRVFIDVIEKNKQNQSFIHDRTNILSILVLLGIAAKTLNNELTDYILSLLFSDDIDLKSKDLILITIPFLVEINLENKKISDKSVPFSILLNNRKAPIIIRSVFYWLAYVLNIHRISLFVNHKETDKDNPYLQMSTEDFIKEVLKGIGQSLSGKSCLFIDDSFSSFAHRQVSEGMIEFIRILINEKNANVLNIVNDILVDYINKLKSNLGDISEDELNILIGLFASLSQGLSAIEPERYISNDLNHTEKTTIIGFDSTLHGININDCGFRFTQMFNGFYTNHVLLDSKRFDLNDKQIENILHLNEILIHSKYFTIDEQKYDQTISQREIEENILISAFYSSLPIIMQNKNNAELLLNSSNFGRSLSLFELGTKIIPTKENSILLLSHYIEQAIHSPFYQPKEKEEIKLIDRNSCFRFMRSNFGEIVYNDDGNDIIKADPDRKNLFIGTRPFSYSYSSYFEIKINKIGMKRIFIGFINSEDTSVDSAFGFGSAGYDGIFCRRSPFLAEKIAFVGDKIMKNEQKHSDNAFDDDDDDDDDYDEKANENENEEDKNDEENVRFHFTSLFSFHKKSSKSKNKNKVDKSFTINEGETLGCYYTPEFCYLVIDKKLTKYRLSHESLKTYIPLIFIDHDEIELEVTQNLTKVECSDKKFDFLILNNLPSDYFTEKDIQKSVQKENYSFSNAEISEKDILIGQQFLISKIITGEVKSKLETIEAIPKKLLQYREHYGIVKDIHPLNNSTFVSKVKLESYNIYSLSKEIIDFDIDSRYLEKIKTNFFSIVENQTRTKFGFNSSFDLNSLPNELQNCSDFNSIRSYLKNKTIKENSKSIAIIMCRYLAFILVDYLRYSKSILLQDEGINSKEMNTIIKSLSFSIPTITTFKPTFYRSFDQERDNKCLIFKDDETEKEEGYEEQSYNFFVPVGFDKLFCRSFIMFLKKSEKTISKDFILRLFQSLYENSIKNQNSTNQSSLLYASIPSCYRIESLSPLPDNFIYKHKIDNDIFRMKKIVGFIPILVSTIPCQFPCVKVEDKLLRQSSNEISYFYSTKDCYGITLKWKYNIDELKKLKINKGKSFDKDQYENYKLKLGLLKLSKYLDEDLLMSQLGFIQVIFLLFQSFSLSDSLYEKHKEMLQGELINNLLTLASTKNLISLPFLQMIIASLISKIGFPKSLFENNVDNSISIFSSDSNKLVQLVNYPNYKNELPLLFSIYSNLCQTRLLENSTKIENKEKMIELFERYYKINKEIFKICNDVISKKESKYIEGEKLKNDSFSDNENELKKKKNFRSLYLVFYYSILLSNEMNIPYPKFIFVHDRLMQQFGGLRTTISKEDIDEYLSANNINIEQQDNTEKVVEYKSKIFENEAKLQCSYKLFNIKEKNGSDDDDNDYDDFNSFDDDDDDENSDEEDDDENEEEFAIFGFDFNSNEDNDEEKSNKDSKPSNKKKKDDKEDKHKIIIHQIQDDSRIELPESGESVVVTFPLEIIIVHVKGKNAKKNKLKVGDAFVIDFLPSKQEEEEFFVNNFSEIEKDFEEFVSLSKYDNELSEKTFTANEGEQGQPNDDTNNNNNNNNNEDDNSNTQNDDDDDNNNSDDESGENKQKFNRNDYKVYEIDKIPMKVESSFSSFTDRVVSLRLSTQSTYRKLIEEIMGSYFLNSDDDDDDESEFENCFTNQIIMPAYSMNTEAKFKFINKVMSNYKTENEKPSLTFNRFEQQKFMEKYKDETSENSNETKDVLTSKYRPLFIQFMEQIDEDSIPVLRVRHDNPFLADLTGENSTDAGGPGRELFSQLIEELMNIHIGVFTTNPNKRHNIKDVNKEDMIPNSSGNKIDETEMNEEVVHLFPRRFIYAGALIACSIVSSLPRPMKLSMIVWEYLTHESVSIENVYEVDKNFQELIESAESLQHQILADFDSITNSEFDQVFPHNFVIQDSFDNQIELITSGSKTKVTKNNLHEFIELAKKVRCDEFKNELKELKEGFDKIMTYKNIVKILRPQELKLLVCGEPNCSIKLMKTMIDISDVYDDNVDQEKLNQTFWNVMESFSVDERMKFIRFSSGNLSLPAPGMKWEENIDVNILPPGKEGKSGKDLAYAQTCSSRIDIPFFESEEQLAAMLRKSMNYSGLITDSHEEVDEVSDFM